MKRSLTVLSIFIAVCIMISCKKQQPQQSAASSTQTVRFILYTNEDLSNDEDTVSFALTIRNNTGSVNSRAILFHISYNTI
jgi:predicted component of type VI protein secretion system